MNTKQVAARLVELCREGNYEQAQEELYAEDAVSIEMPGLPEGALGDGRGMDAIRAKGRAWQASIEQIHGGSVGDPIIAGDWFSLVMRIDATYKDMGRLDMSEICVYRVRDDKIVHEQFFYSTG